MYTLSATVRYSDNEYPRRLNELGGEAPETIWLRGQWRSSDRKAVAIVGSRAASARGVAFARALGQQLGASHYDVISGGAIGVDAAAHEGALSVGGHTVAVLGTGLNRLYPLRHVPLFQQIIGCGGALVTGFAPEVGPLRGNFPRRNSLIAALADVVVVVEASLESGSLYTAAAARRLGRQLCVFVGSPGTDLLHEQGATPVVEVADVLSILGGQAPKIVEPAGEMLRVYEQLGALPCDTLQLAQRAGFPISTCAMLLGELENAGWARRTLGGYSRLR